MCQTKDFCATCFGQIPIETLKDGERMIEVCHIPLEQTRWLSSSRNMILILYAGHTRFISLFPSFLDSFIALELTVCYVLACGLVGVVPSLMGHEDSFGYVLWLVAVCFLKNKIKGKIIFRPLNVKLFFLVFSFTFLPFPYH